MTQAGQYRHPITVQRLKAAATADNYNHIDESKASNWETYCDRRCDIKSSLGTEQHTDQTFAVCTHLLVVRADATTRAITTRMRILLGSQTLQIVGVVADKPKRNEMLIGCKERQ